MLERIFLVAILAVATSFSPLSVQDEATRPVKLLTVKPQGFGPERVFFGRVVAKETVGIAFQVGGQVLTFPATQGDMIAARTTVAQLEPEPFDLALEQAQRRPGATTVYAVGRNRGQPRGA